MRITGLEVDGFGVWNGLTIDGLADGLNVFYGPNEAGKTTLMQFVRSVLYGYSPERRRYFPALGGDRAGGTLRLNDQSAHFRLSRHLVENKCDALEQFMLTDAAGARQGDHQLRTLLSNIDEKIYNNVFAVGLRELQELGTLSDTEAAALLYNLSIGVDRVSLVEVGRELEASRRRILDPGAGPSQIANLLAQREKLVAELREAGTLTPRYSRLAGEHDQTDRDVRRLESEAGQLRQDGRVLQVALTLRERWQQRGKLDEQLAALGASDSLDDETVERFELISRTLAKHQARLKDLMGQRKRIHQEAATLAVNETLWRLSPRIEAVAEQGDWIGKLESRIAELEREIGGLEGQLTAEQQRLGLTEAKPEVVAALSGRTASALRPPAAAMSRARKRLETVRQEIATGEEAARTIGRQIESALSSRGINDLDAAMERTAALVAQLRRRVQIDERLEQMDRYQAELEDQSRGLLDRQLLPGWIVIALGVAFALGVVLLMAGLVMPKSVVGSLGWLLTPLGLGGALAAVAAKFILERSNARRLEGCQKQIHMLQTQIRQARQEREHLDSQLPKGGGPITSRLQAAEQELASLEELAPLGSRLYAAKQESTAAASRLDSAQKELAAAEHRWQDSLAAAGLPRKLTPKQVRGILDRSELFGDVRRRLEIRYEELQQRTRELDGVTHRIGQLTAETKLNLTDRPAVDQLRALVAQVAEQDERRKRRDGLRAEDRGLRRKVARHDKAARRLKSRRRELLRRAGVHDEVELRRRADELSRARALRQERERVQGEIEAAVAGHCTLDNVAVLLDGDRATQLEALCEETARRLATVEAQLAERFEQRGRLAEQLKAIADDRTPARKQLELAELDERIEEAANQWRRLALTSRILHRVRKTYERDRQPEALREASVYLERFTHGRYRRVWTPLDEDVLVIDTTEGRSLSVEMLSQGTREQLFLCLRLSLAGLYARRGATLPLVLDDVLVNFDSERAKHAAAALRDFAAAGHQLLVFTCHEHISELFGDLGVRVIGLPPSGVPARLDLAGDTPTIERPAVKKKRRRPRPDPVTAVEEELVIEEPVAEEPIAEPAAEEPIEAPAPPILPPWEEYELEPIVESRPIQTPVVEQEFVEEEIAEEPPPALPPLGEDWSDRYIDEYDIEDEYPAPADEEDELEAA
jgi:uncharacterized protein YhaN